MFAIVAIGGILEGLILIYFISALVPKKFTFLKTWLIFVGTMFLAQILLWPIWDTMSLRDVINIGISMLSIVFLFGGKNYKKLLSFVAYLVVIVFTETIIVFVLKFVLGHDISTTRSDSLMRLIHSGFVYALAFLVCLIIIRVWKRRCFELSEKAIQYVLAFIVTQLIIFLVVTAMMMEFKVYSWILMCFLFVAMIASGVIGYVMVKTLEINTLRKTEKLFFEEQLSMRDRHWDEMCTQFEEYKKLKHDFYNHMGVIEGLRSIGNYGKLESYVTELKGKLGRMENVIFSKNSALDALLFLKNQNAEDLGIEIEFNIIEPDPIPLSDMALCSAVSNLLDNAIRGASEYLGFNKYVYYESYVKANQYVIVVRNSSNPVPDLESTKTEKRLHGLGIKIIKSIMRQYNGNAVFRYESAEFISVINFNLSDEKIQK